MHACSECYRSRALAIRFLELVINLNITASYYKETERLFKLYKGRRL